MKAQKNPFQPKKPKSSYFYFCDDFRSKLIEKFHKKHPNEKVSISDVAKQLGKKWKELKDKDKKKYQAQADVDKKRYEKELEEFNEKYA